MTRTTMKMTGVAETVTTISGKTLVCIVGPTAVGKTTVGISLAKTFGTEIISADSRQFYAEMNIGTAKPSPEELAEVPHHFVGFLSVKEAYSAGNFERDALKKIEELFQHHDIVFLVGGSGLFVEALCRGMDELPVVEEHIRQKYNRLFNEGGLSPLQRLLEEKDPVYYQKVDRRNPQRIIRALEVIEATGQPFSILHKKKWVKRAFRIVTIGLNLPREMLYQRINERVNTMLEKGLVKEAQNLARYRHTYALQTVGYAELYLLFDSKINYEQAVDLIKQNTRRYAKRQLTWFRRNPETQWFAPDDLSAMVNFIQQKKH